MERTISGMMGKGSVSHNTRAFTAKNVDQERNNQNVCFCNQNIKEVYHQLFDEALERYNEKQKRSDRKIGNYYEKIRQGKQEKLFYEVIFQIGNKDDMNAKSEEGVLAKEILTEFMEEFAERNQCLHVFSANLHMDEETPHLHIDFIPFICNGKRGMDTRVSLKGALKELGFSGGTRGATEWNQWIEAEKKELSAVMGRHGIRWHQKGTHEKHLSLLEYEKKERIREALELDDRIQVSIRTLEKTDDLVKSQMEKVERLSLKEESLRTEHGRLEEKNKVLRQEQTGLNNKVQELYEVQNIAVKKLEQTAITAEQAERLTYFHECGAEWQLPEPAGFMGAKAYRDTKALPLVKRLKEKLKELIVQYVDIRNRYHHLLEQVKELQEEVW